MTNSKNKKQSLASSLKRYTVPAIVSIILLLISVVCQVSIPKNIQGLTDTISNAIKNTFGSTVTVDIDKILSYAIPLILLCVATFLASFISGFILNTCIQNYSKSLRKQIANKINVTPLNYFDTRSIGDIMSVVVNDVDLMATSLQNSVTILIQSVMLLVASVIAMFVTSWQLALVVICSLPLLLIVLFVIMKLALPLFDKNQQYLGEVNTTTEENYFGQLIIKAFNAEDYKAKEFIEKNNKLRKTLFKSQALGGLIQPLMTAVSFITYAAVLVVGGILVINGQQDFGVITAFLVYVGLFQEPISQIGESVNLLQIVAATSKRVFEFLNEEEILDESDKPKELLDHNNIKGAVEFNDVYFGYVPEKMLVQGFSAKIKPGMKVAVVGPTGAGKTTLVNLLMRFYEINKGSITVDGVNVQDMTREELHSVFGMILQETWIINGSLRENIVYNMKDVDEDRLNEILEKTNLAHYVSTLPEGLDTDIKAESALSAGQKQLVTIARAMVENAPMMILDEATSNVDTRTEILISQAMDELTKGRTSFCIAHRLSTIKNADLILVMKDGNIVETGTHDTLMEQNGLYSEIYNAQFQSA